MSLSTYLYSNRFPFGYIHIQTGKRRQTIFLNTLKNFSNNHFCFGNIVTISFINNDCISHFHNASFNPL